MYFTNNDFFTKTVPHELEIQTIKKCSALILPSSKIRMK